MENKTAKSIEKEIMVALNNPTVNIRQLEILLGFRPLKLAVIKAGKLKQWNLEEFDSLRKHFNL